MLRMEGWLSRSLKKFCVYYRHLFIEIFCICWVIYLFFFLNFCMCTSSICWLKYLLFFFFSFFFFRRKKEKEKRVIYYWTIIIRSTSTVFPWWTDAPNRLFVKGVRLSSSLSLSAWLSVCLCVCLSFCMSVCLSISVWLLSSSVCLRFCLSVSIYLSVCLSLQQDSLFLRPIWIWIQCLNNQLLACWFFPSFLSFDLEDMTSVMHRTSPHYTTQHPK